VFAIAWWILVQTRDDVRTLGAAGSSASRRAILVRRLERDGLIERRADPTDARASLIFLTARSRRFKRVAAATLTNLDQLVRKRLSAQELDNLKSALRKLRALE
jgi:DNA-binding MarR family transcriptional regulator